MNRYKITYIVDEGETETAYITERTEAAARKVFKAVSKGREIADVELDDTDVPATKGYRAAKERRGACERIIAGLEALSEK